MQIAAMLCTKSLKHVHCNEKARVAFARHLLVLHCSVVDNFWAYFLFVRRWFSSGYLHTIELIPGFF